jgi:pimeloyl-ACP methyl ester carboxylesterase
MKKALYVLPVIVLIFISANLISHHFRSDLYNLAIQFESDKAKLTKKNIEINHQQYYYLSRESQNSKEIVLLLHGFSANKENWLRFSQNLPSQYQVFALDLLGHGQHDINLDFNYSIETQVDYLHTFITEVIKQPIHIVGNSMGGAIASLYAATYPNEVKTLMLISPAGIHDIPSEMDTIIKEKGVNPLIANSVSQFFDVVDFVMEEQPFIPNSILTVQAERSINRYALNKKIFFDIKQDLTKNLDQKFSFIQAQTLILWGQEDRVINVKNIERYASLIPNAKARILKGIGHLAMIETPELAAQAFIKLSSASHTTVD